MSDKVSQLVALRNFWRSLPPAPSVARQHDRSDLHSQYEQTEDLNGVAPDPLQFEFSRHVLKKAARVLKKSNKKANKTDADWLNEEFIRPSNEFGRPIAATSGSPDLVKFQHLWELAVAIDPSIKDEGALIIDAKKNGSPVTGVDILKHKVKPETIQANVMPIIGGKPALQQPQPGPPASPHQPTAMPTSASTPNENLALSSDPVSSPVTGGVKVSQSSPTAISATSSLRSGTSSNASGGGITHASRYAAAATNSDGMFPVPFAQQHPESHGLSNQNALAIQNSPRMTAHDNTPSHLTPEPGFQQFSRRPRRYSGSTTYSSSATTVTFQAMITSGGDVTAVPFGIDDMTETVEDVMAFVDWKNSDSGRCVPVDFRTFTSIMRFRPSASNALILCKKE
ncbi:hypothetical protein GTA08_BOTSDO14095 [Neofusicoccum parvum]|uniref:Uncharacterized protein n=1 Tax=Neofusicoccum parvum TaxID=310453 RepID=A0ACB5SHX4_9PEZI|nr:hypothetical protein GTA08_BOTSDO14095 [Neofusicoccum parvum]